MCAAKEDDHILFTAIKSGRAADALAFFDDIRDTKNCYRQETLDQGLVLACVYGRIFLVQILIFHGANIETRDDDGNTPLLICAEKGFTDIALLLVDKGADINSYNKDGDTALLLSISTSGDYRLIKKLVKNKYQLNFRHINKNGYTALSKCFEVLNFPLLQFLQKSFNRSSRLDFKINRNEKSNDNTVDIVNTLGLDLIYSNLEDGNSFLKTAVFQRDLRTTHVLLCTETCGGEDYIVKDFLCYLNQNEEIVDEAVLSIVQMLVNNSPLARKCALPLDEAVELGDMKLIELLCRHITDAICFDSPMILAINKGRCDIIQLFINFGAKLNYCDYIEIAIEYGLIDCAMLLHQNGAFTNVKTAICIAVKKEQASSLLFLAEFYKRETQDALGECGAEILIEAVEKSNEKIIKILIEMGIDVNSTLQGKTALMVAKDRDIIQLLIQNGADTNKIIIANRESYTVLSYILKKCLGSSHYAKYNILETITPILENTYDLNITDSAGDTPLMLAVRIPNFSEVVRLLLYSGADVSIQNKEGKTALHFAVGYCSVEVVKLLLEYKADVNTKCNQGRTPLFNAVEENLLETTKLLLENKVDINIKCVNGHTPLLIAVEKGFLDTAKVLLENKADVNTQSVNYQSPLMIAVARSNIAMVKLLIENDATIDDEDNKGETALFRVGSYHQKNHCEVVNLLAEAGTCLDHQNKEGQTAMMLAAKSKNLNLIKVLYESGADVKVVNVMKKETVMSILTNNAKYPCDFVAIDNLIKNGANIAYVSSSFVHLCIRKKQWSILRQVIALGLGPGYADLKYSNYDASPLEAALIKEHAKLAKYFNDIWFLTRSDITVLFSDYSLYNSLLASSDPSCLEFFENYLTQPMSLQKLSFVVVSSAVGAEPEREERIRKLKLPVVFENKLLFKHALEVEIEPEADDSTNKTDQQYVAKDLFSEERKRKEKIRSEMYEPYSFDDDYLPSDSDSWYGW